MLVDEDLFDFSGYPRGHLCFSIKNKKVMCKMKDELNGIKMQEFIGFYDNIEMKKTKGVNKNVIKQQIHHADYRECICEYKKCVHSMNMIRSEKHKVFMITQNKIMMIRDIYWLIV